MSDAFEKSQERSRRILLAFAAVALGLTCGGTISRVFPVGPWIAGGISLALAILSVAVWPRYKTVSLAAIWTLILATAGLSVYLAVLFFSRL